MSRLSAIAVSERADALGLAIVVVLLVAFFSLDSPYFLSTSNFSAIGVAISGTAIIAAVQTIVLVSGGLDLSITAVLALSGIAAGAAVGAGWPAPAAMVLGVLVGGAAGLLNAAIIVGVGVNPLIATIGTQFVFRGIALITTQGQTSVLPNNPTFNFLGNGHIFGVPVPIVLMLVVFLIVGGAMRFTRFGSHVYATGGSQQAARLSGLAIWRLRTLVYVLSGCAAAVGGMVLVGQSQQSFPQAGLGEELTIIGAVILGGTSLAGGRGTVFGTALGVCLLGVLANGLNLIGIAAFWQTLIQGLILVVAVTLDEVRRRWRGR